MEETKERYIRPDHLNLLQRKESAIMNLDRTNLTTPFTARGSCALQDTDMVKCRKIAHIGTPVCSDLLLVWVFFTEMSRYVRGSSRIMQSLDLPIRRAIDVHVAKERRT